MNFHSEPAGKYDMGERVSWFMSRFLVMVSRVPGLAETMTKGDMGDVMVCTGHTRARTGASRGSLKRTSVRRVMVSAVDRKGQTSPNALRAAMSPFAHEEMG